jgi:hypothetical protein
MGAFRGPAVNMGRACPQCSQLDLAILTQWTLDPPLSIYKPGLNPVQIKLCDCCCCCWPFAPG